MYNRRAMRHDRRAGLLWIHCLFGLATNPSIGTASYPLSKDIWRCSNLLFQRDDVMVFVATTKIHLTGYTFSFILLQRTLSQHMFPL